MNTDYLKEFIALAETKNFWEAAERLFMNQSTLSKHIKALENDLGVELFRRTTRRVELTNYGYTFLPHANAIVKSELDGITAIQRLKHIENGLLTIGSIPSMPQYNITMSLAKFQHKYPQCTVRITEDDPINLIHYLENESCEVIITREDKATFENNFLRNPAIKVIPYMKDNLVAVMPKTHPLAGSSAITLQQLKDELFCFIKEGTLMYSIATNACQQAGFVPNVIFTSHRIDSILDIISNQNCVALLMDKHLEMPHNGPDDPGAPWTYVPIVPNISSQISLCYRSDKELSATAKLFVEYILDTIFKKEQS